MIVQNRDTFGPYFRQPGQAVRAVSLYLPQRPCHGLHPGSDHHTVRSGDHLQQYDLRFLCLLSGIRSVLPYAHDGAGGGGSEVQSLEKKYYLMQFTVYLFHRPCCLQTK